MPYLKNVSVPPASEEDAIDLSDHEVARAVVTKSREHLTELLKEEVMPGHASVSKNDGRYSIALQEIRRRSPHLYLRTRLVCAPDADKVLVFRVDWLQQTPE